MFIVFCIGVFFEYVDYVMLKGVMDLFIKGFLLEFVVKNICVNSVWFGFIKIDIYVDGGEFGRVEWISL